MNVRDRITDFRRVKASELAPHPANWRKHGESQSRALKHLLESVGYADALLVYLAADGKLTLVDGHLRRSLTPNQEVPVLVTDLTEAEARVVLRSLDPLAAMADADDAALAALVEQIDDAGLEQLLGGLEEAAGGLLPDADPDAIPEEVETRCKPGDLWALSEHRLLCGDSTKAEDVARLMGGEKAQMVFTDPPYNVDYSADSYSDGRSEKWGRIKNDALGEQFPAFCEAFATAIDSLMENGAVYVCAPMRPAGIQIRVALAKRFQFKDTIVWFKDHYVVGRNDYHPQYEDVLYCFKGDRVWHGGRNQSNVWQFPRVLKERSHPTQKPVELIEKALINSSDTDAVVVDLFGGSGSTLIACEANRRHCYTSEVDASYCDVILARWESVTGQQARLL